LSGLKIRTWAKDTGCAVRAQGLPAKCGKARKASSGERVGCRQVRRHQRKVERSRAEFCATGMGAGARTGALGNSAVVRWLSAHIGFRKSPTTVRAQPAGGARLGERRQLLLSSQPRCRELAGEL